jgi:ADP-ribosylglycohydrolase
LLGSVRLAVADALGVPATFVSPSAITARYEALMAMKRAA